MIAVIFEVWPAEGRKDDYLRLAAALRSELDCADGFISIERFQSLTEPAKLLSLSFWRDEEAVRGWRNNPRHRATQAAGRAGIFADYRLRIGAVIRNYGMTDRAEAPAHASLAATVRLPLPDLVHSAARSAKTMQVRLGFLDVMLGIAEASTTRRFSTPRTWKYWSTTAAGSLSGPILQVPTGCQMVALWLRTYSSSRVSSATVSGVGKAVPVQSSCSEGEWPIFQQKRTPSTMRRMSSGCE